MDRDASPLRKNARMDKLSEDVENITSVKKHELEDLDSIPAKRPKLNENEPLTPKKRNQNGQCTADKRMNFIMACQQISSKEYHNFSKRLGIKCNFRCVNNKVIAMSDCKQEAFNIDYKSNMWCEALDVCRDVISHNVYLTADIMQNICEIILNAHEAKFEGYTLKYVLDRCRHILNMNFNTHISNPNTKLRKSFQQFLVKPLSQKEGSYSDRELYDCGSGIFKYCIRRLEKEIQPCVEECPLVDKFADLPNNVGMGVQQIHWKREKFEILETLNKTERLERLFVTLDCLIDLLQKDMVVWLQRYSHNPVGHIMKPNKPLIAFILWQNNSLYTGSITLICKQIFRLFVCLIDYGFNEKYVLTLSKLINIIAEVMYACEKNSGEDYPNIGKYVTNMTVELFSIAKEYSYDTVAEALAVLKPMYIQYLLGEMFLKYMLKFKTNDTLTLIKIILKDYDWTNCFPRVNSSDVYKHRIITVDKLFKKYKKILRIKINQIAENSNHKESSWMKENLHTEVHIITILYSTLLSYTRAYALQDIHEYYEHLNARRASSTPVKLDNRGFRNTIVKEIVLSSDKERAILNFNNRAIMKTTECKKIKLSEFAAKRYREIFKALQEVIKVFDALKNTNPRIVEVFKTIKLLELT